MDQAKYNQMQAMLHKLEDIKNSQESIIDKINHVITDLFQNPDKDLEKAMEASSNEYGDLPTILKGNSSLFISDTANAPAKIIKDFRKKSTKPVFKGAYINSEIYIGDELLDSLASLKSKEEVIGEIIGLLQSPAQRVISALLNHAEGKSEE